MEHLNAAVLGLGLGRVHVGAYADHEAVERLAICDPDREKLRAVEEEVPRVAAAYESLDDLLAAEQPDVVSIVTPDHLHRPQAESCLEAGTHVLVTKPLATKLEDGRAMVRAAESAEHVLMVAHERRFRSRFRAIKELLESGSLGEIIDVRIDTIQDKRGQFAGSPWYASEEAGRTPIVGTGIHQVDLLRYLVDRPVRSVCALASHRGELDFPGDTTTAALFDFEGGAIGEVTVTYEAHWPAEGARGNALRLVATGGVVVGGSYATDQGEGWQELPGDDSGIVTGSRGCVEAFLHSVLTGEPPPVDGREGFRSLAACVAADESAATGRPVKPASADF